MVHIRLNMRYILFIAAFILMASSPMWVQLVTDVTLTGGGIPDSPLKVDTSVIATVNRTNGGRSTYITPAQITSDQDNYNPTGFASATHVRISGDADIQAVTSLVAMGGAITDVFEKTLINVGSYALYFPMEHPDGTASGRITGYTGDFILYPGMSVKIWYDMAGSRWRILEFAPSYTQPTMYFSKSAAAVTIVDEFTISGTGGNETNLAATTSLPAAMQLTTSASSTAYRFGYFSRGVVQYAALASAHIFLEATVSIPTLSDGTNTFTSLLQILNDPTSATESPNNSIGIRYSHGVNSGKWQLYSKDTGGTESLADLGTTVVAGTIYKIRVEIDKAKSEARAYVNGSFAGRVTGNMPNTQAVSGRIMHIKSLGATARTLNIHNISSGAIYP